jgi:uncharacterized integral membrane protein
MLTLILGVLLTVFVGYFATQNTTSVPIHLTGYTQPSVPLYIVILGSLLLGLLIAGLLNLLSGIGAAFTLRGKDAKAHQLENQIAKLEKENATLRERHSVIQEENKDVRDDVLAERHPLLHNIKHSLS